MPLLKFQVTESINPKVEVGFRFDIPFKEKSDYRSDSEFQRHRNAVIISALDELDISVNEISFREYSDNPGPLYIGIFKNNVSKYDPLIRILLDNCVYTHLYILRERKEDMEWLIEKNSDILIKEKGKYRLDVSKECIKGHEKLWDGYVQGKGTILIVMKDDFDLFGKLFEEAWKLALAGNLSGNKMNLGGLNTPRWLVPAVKKCKEEKEKGNIAVTPTWSREGISLVMYVKRYYELRELAATKFGWSLNTFLWHKMGPMKE